MVRTLRIRPIKPRVRLQATPREGYYLIAADGEIVRLSLRELEVTMLVAGEGLSDQEIAGRLDLTVQYVKNLLLSAYDKMAVQGRLQLAVWLWRSRQI